MTSIARLTGHHGPIASARDDGLSAGAGSTQQGRDEWIVRCGSRLRGLRPHHDQSALQLVATEMWVDVGMFDPVIAAELECEAWPPEH